MKTDGWGLGSPFSIWKVRSRVCRIVNDREQYFEGMYNIFAMSGARCAVGARMEIYEYPGVLFGARVNG